MDSRPRPYRKRARISDNDKSLDIFPDAVKAAWLFSLPFLFHPYRVVPQRRLFTDPLAKLC